MTIGALLAMSLGTALPAQTSIHTPVPAPPRVVSDQGPPSQTLRLARLSLPRERLMAVEGKLIRASLERQVGDTRGLSAKFGAAALVRGEDAATRVYVAAIGERMDVIWERLAWFFDSTLSRVEIACIVDYEGHPYAKTLDDHASERLAANPERDPQKGSEYLALAGEPDIARLARPADTRYSATPACREAGVHADALADRTRPIIAMWLREVESDAKTKAMDALRNALGHR